MASVNSARTALTRVTLSRPVASAIADGVLNPSWTLFDFGCGRGQDLLKLRELGYIADGWDPNFRPEARIHQADVVNLGYVINVIEDPFERASTLKQAWELTSRVLIVSARLTWEARELIGYQLADGIITKRGTFQKFFSQSELASWINSVLGVRPVAAAPGIFYAFRDLSAEQDWLSRRVYVYRPRVVVDPHVRFQHYETDLAPLVAFASHHGRLPRSGELRAEDEDRIRHVFGSLQAGSTLVRQVIAGDRWLKLEGRRREELLIYVAMSRFSSRPKFSHLGYSLATDIRSIFGSYREACLQADKLLLAAGNPVSIYLAARGSAIGKQTPSALYIHSSALDRLSPLLRVYEACARILSGDVPNTDLVKLSVAQPLVSYLSYPRFDRDPHPTLKSATTVNLRELSVGFREYGKSRNPPLLHRKEEFLGPEDPRKELYEKLTRSEWRAGLYARPEEIGNLLGWNKTLESAGLSLRGHRLVRRKGTEA